jgi:hypothetical protein
MAPRKPGRLHPDGALRHPCRGAHPPSRQRLRGRGALPDERLGIWLVAGGLASLVLALGLGVHSVSEVQARPPSSTTSWPTRSCSLPLVSRWEHCGGPPGPGECPWRVAALSWPCWPSWWRGTSPTSRPFESPDGGWPAAEAAAQRVEKDSGGSAVALVALFEPTGTTAYSYPLTQDGVTRSAPESASVVVLLSDAHWLDGCGVEAEAAWIANHAAGSGLVLVDHFAAAPQRFLSVYRRAP